jgi:hypothetical protein
MNFFVPNVFPTFVYEKSYICKILNNDYSNNRYFIHTIKTILTYKQLKFRKKYRVMEKQKTEKHSRTGFPISSISEHLLLSLKKNDHLHC